MMLYRFHPPSDQFDVLSFEAENFDEAIERVNGSLIDPKTSLVACPSDESSDLVGMEMKEDSDREDSYSIVSIRYFRILRKNDVN